MANLVKFLSGSKAAYSGLTAFDESTLYFIKDTQELYKGNLAIGNNHITGTAGNIVAVGADGQGLSATPYKVVNELPDGTSASASVPTVALVTKMIGDVTIGAVTGATAEGDSYISISATKSAPESPVIEIVVSANTGDVASDSVAAGLVADAKNVHDYIDTVSGNLDVTFETPAEPSEGYLKTYKITKGTGSTAETLTIDIPKDFLVKSATIKECETKDVPVTGLVPGEKYLDLEINVKDGEEEESHIYIPVKELGVEYGAGEHIEITTTGSNATINVTGITTDGTGITEDSNDLTEGKAVYEFVKSEIISGVTIAGNDYIEVNAELYGQDLALSAMPIVASSGADIESADADTYKLASDYAVKEYVDAKTQAHSAYTTITINGDNGTTSSQSASTSASTATVTFGAASAATTGSFIGVTVDSANKVTTTVNVATTAAEVSGATADNLISTLAVQELMTWGTIPEPTIPEPTED